MLDGLPPGWRTHLMFAAFDGEVDARADPIVVRSPRSPGYYWGNFLLYRQPPTEADFGPWMQRFDEAIVARAPGTRHRAFGIATPAAGFQLPPAFAAAGFVAYPTATLTLQAAALRPLPRALDDGVELRPLRLPEEADAVVELNMACNATDEHGYEPDGYRCFRHQQMLRYAAMQAAGMGHWWGALHEGRVVASLGLFGRGDPGGRAGNSDLGRFQHVETHPAFRRRGLCRALVHAACRHGFEQRGWQTLVLGADPDDVAIGIYRSVGFSDAESIWLLERRPPEDLAPA